MNYEIIKCYICGAETDPDNVCDMCGEYICDNPETCAAASTQHDIIEAIRCKNCHEFEKIQASDHYQRIESEKERVEEEKRKKREKTNRAARERYHKPENVEKRRKARIERKLQEWDDFKESLKRAFEIFDIR